MTITDAEVEAALAVVREKDHFIVNRPVMVAALRAASQARALSSGEGWSSMEDFPADEQIVEVRRIGEPERWNAARYRTHHDATADYMQWRRPLTALQDQRHEQ